jgi:hypothetical protein
LGGRLPEAELRTRTQIVNKHPSCRLNQETNHKKPRIITQKLIARLNDAEGVALDRMISAIIARAQEGDVPAFREIMDRVEGKPAQAIIGGDEDDPAINLVHRIERVIVNAPNTDG